MKTLSKTAVKNYALFSDAESVFNSKDICVSEKEYKLRKLCLKLDYRNPESAYKTEMRIVELRNSLRKR